jgi:hypothetical protein
MMARRAGGGHWAAALLLAAARLGGASVARAEPPSAESAVGEVTESGAAQVREDGAVEPPGDRQREAERLRARAQLLFDQEQYSAAAAQFERAFLLTGAARDRFNLGTALHWQGDCNGAREAFQQYLALEDVELFEREERRADAATALLHLERQCPAPRRATSGSARRARPEGSGSTPEGSTVPVRLPADEAQSGAAAGPSEVWMWAAFGTGAALGLASIVTAVAASNATSDLEDLGRTAAGGDSSWEECCAERARELNTERQRLQTATTVLAVSSVVLVGSGAVLWSLDLDGGAPNPTGHRLQSVRLAYRAQF